MHTCPYKSSGTGYGGQEGHSLGLGSGLTFMQRRFYSKSLSCDMMEVPSKQWREQTITEISSGWQPISYVECE